eukprot:TRINITY_DN5420_c0_g1_i1.p1 TRINITY_DN5420_c0_g1~~TRINITY_DN5420_c0_g1_i1.p1  ORF type:complete len:208 (-),score=32.53 TRINITY_DN5420_c0_g1_i1:25-648(-)
MKILIFLLFFLPCFLTFEFEVQLGERKCFWLDLETNTLVKGNYYVTNLPYLQMSLRILNPNGEQMYKNEDIKEGTFAFTADIDGQYETCFLDTLRSISMMPIGSPNKRTVELEFMPEEPEQDYSAIAKKEKLKPLEIQIRVIEDLVKHIRLEMLHRREREERHRDVNESTNSRAAWLSILTMSILVLSVLCQIFYLRSFFKSRSLIE